MLPDKIVPISAAAIFTFSQLFSPPAPVQVVAAQIISLDNRYEVKSVSDVFQDNILLNLAYMRGLVQNKEDINWEEVKRPFVFEFRLEPNQTFAYHDDVLPEYKDSLVRTTQAHFNASEGFKTDGYLYGDGVCHLASLIYWVAKDAGLEAVAPTNHDFMAIPEIDKKYGVSIYSNPFSKGANTKQNLYVRNNTDKGVVFKFEYRNENLRLSILKDLN